jgi:prophage maintenance system killer protein
MNEIIKFVDGDFELEVIRGDEDNITWLNAKEIALLFERDVTVIRRHLNSIFKDDILDEKENVKKLDIENSKKPVTYYNLDVILQVGYRVKSKRGIMFRKWSTGILKQYLTEGIAYNEKILKAHQKVLNIIPLLERNIDKIDGSDVLRVVHEYASALELLDDYDHQRIKRPEGNNKILYRPEYNELRELINHMSYNKESYLFGMERDDSFKSSINTIYASYDGVDFYETVEEKAAYLFYFIVKNHSFIDGNKRIAATVFLHFLYKNDILYTNEGNQVLAGETLVALTIMIATSKPEEKNIVIDLVMNLIKN